jgi:hypothetical protein
LAKTEQNLEQEFEIYFQEFGTHYFASAAVGGQRWHIFNTEAGDGDQDMANCIASKFSIAHGLQDGNQMGSSCKKIGGEQLAQIHHIKNGRCSGGDATDCPFEDKTRIAKWRESINRHPNYVLGQKKWVTQLIAEILRRSKNTSDAEQHVYKKIIGDFGNQTNFNDDWKALEQFRAVLHKQLIKYLEKNSFLD